VNIYYYYGTRCVYITAVGSSRVVEFMLIFSDVWFLLGGKNCYFSPTEPVSHSSLQAASSLCFGEFWINQNRRNFCQMKWLQIYDILQYWTAVVLCGRLIGRLSLAVVLCGRMIGSGSVWTCDWTAVVLCGRMIGSGSVWTCDWTAVILCGRMIGCSSVRPCD